MYNSDNLGTKTALPRSETAPNGVETPAPLADRRLAVDRTILPAHPGEDRFPSPDYKSFHTCTIPTTRGRKRTSPGSIPPRRVWNPEPHWPVADWLRLMEPTRGESCPSSQHQRPAAPEEDNVLSPDDKSLFTSTTPTTQGRKRRSPGSTPPHRVWKSEPHWLVADWLRFMEPARGESCPSGRRRRPAAPGEDKNILPYLYNSTKLGTKTQIPRVDTAPHGVDTPTPLAGC